MLTKDNCPVCRLTKEVEELEKTIKDLRLALVDAREYICQLQNERDQQ